MMNNRVGQQFGMYHLLSLLGKGGFAEVYLGEHIYIQSKAAIKVLNATLATSEAQSFLQEARTLVKLEHANIVGIKEFDIKQGIPFLVMNYASNGTLHQRHPRGQCVPLETIIPYVLQVASALQYAHDRQIVHRDVKPDNMLIDNNGTILLSDFGIAILSSSTHSHGGQAGTYLYMAPEQITGKALPASDQYALGITIYEWLCGEAPFVGSAAEVTAKHIHASPQPLHQRGIAIDPQVERVIVRALEKDPRQRFASVQEFALNLQNSSNAQPGKGMHIPAPGSHNSIFPSPSPKAPGFTYPSTPIPPVSPRLTPHITHTVPPLPIAPTIYPGNVPYAPTQPATQYVQPRKTGSLCLLTTLLSVVLFFLIVIASGLFLSQILTPTANVKPTATVGVISTPTADVNPTATVGVTPTPTANVNPTATIGVISTPTADVIPAANTPIVPTDITVSPQTLTATNGSTTPDCNFGPSSGTQSGWYCHIKITNNGQSMVNWFAKATDSQVDFQPGNASFLLANQSIPLTIHIPLKDCPGEIDITITPDGGGAPQEVTWTCS